MKTTFWNSKRYLLKHVLGAGGWVSLWERFCAMTAGPDPTEEASQLYTQPGACQQLGTAQTWVLHVRTWTLRCSFTTFCKHWLLSQTNFCFLRGGVGGGFPPRVLKQDAGQNKSPLQTTICRPELLLLIRILQQQPQPIHRHHAVWQTA